MRRNILLLLTLMSFGLCQTTAAQSQREFHEENDHYRIALLGDWQPLVYMDSVGRRKTEFVFRERDQGLLKITREDLSGQSLANKVQSDLEDLKWRLACSYTEQEVFRGGLLSGIRVALCYFEDNHQVMSTYYYLQDGKAVWVLRFTARENGPGLARDLTDNMARSFCSVCPIP